MHDDLRTFDHHRLHAYQVALDALIGADAIARTLPRGYGPISDHPRRASQSAFLQTAEGAARSGADRVMRLRSARAEAGEAAAALEALAALGIADEQACERVIWLLGRLCAMLGGLAPRR